MKASKGVGTGIRSWTIRFGQPSSLEHLTRDRKQHALKKPDRDTLQLG